MRQDSAKVDSSGNALCRCCLCVRYRPIVGAHVGQIAPEPHVFSPAKDSRRRIRDGGRFGKKALRTKKVEHITSLATFTMTGASIRKADRTS